MSSVIPSDSPLTDLQRAFLRAFFGASGADVANSEAFMLAGGTALAGFYLRHRYSDDIDLFTHDREAMRGGLDLVERTLTSLGLEIVAVIRPPGPDGSIHVNVAGDPHPLHPLRKIDLIKDPPPQSAPPEVFDGVHVMQVKDIAIAKLCAVSRLLTN